MTVLHFPRQSRLPLDTDALIPLFELFTDRTGKPVGPNTVISYARHFGELGLTAETVNEAAHQIATTWEHNWWPSAQYIGLCAQQLHQRTHQRTTGTTDRASEAETQSRLEQQRQWDARLADADAWAAKHPIDAEEIRGEVERATDRLMHRFGEQSRFAAIPGYREAFREGALISAVIAEMATEHTVRAQRRHERRMERRSKRLLGAA